LLASAWREDGHHSAWSVVTDIQLPHSVDHTGVV
jgi:hypothetical protein